MYDELVKELRNMFKAYKATDNENCRHAKTILKAADAIEELSHEAEQSKRELDVILPWFGEFMLDMDEDELKEIIKAKREDRLIILPVTFGIPIFCDGDVFAPHCAGKVHELVDWRYSYPMIQQYFRGELDYELDPDEYNKSWFTDRKKCEDYLNKKYHRKSEAGQNDGV